MKPKITTIIAIIFLIFLISPFRVCAAEDLLDGFESSSNWNVGYGDVLLTIESDNSNQKNSYLTIHFNDNLKSATIELVSPDKLNLALYEGVAIEYFVPVTNDNIFLVLYLYESDGSVYASPSIPLEKSGWTRCPMYFINFKEIYQTSDNDENRKLDLNQINKIFFFIASNNTEHVIPKNFKLNLDDFKGITPSEINEAYHINNYQIISKMESRHIGNKVIDNDGNYYAHDSNSFYNKNGDVIFTANEIIRYAAVSEKHLITASIDEIYSYNKDDWTNFNWQYEIENTDEKYISDVSVSNNGKYIVAMIGNAKDELILLHNNKLVKKIRGSTSYRVCSISPNGKNILLLSVDPQPSMLRLYDNTGSLIWENAARGIENIILKDDGIIVYRYASIELYDMNFNFISKKNILYIDGNYYYVDSLTNVNTDVNAVGFSSSSDISAVSIDNSILFLNAETIINKINVDKPVKTLAISPNGKYVIGSTENAVYLFTNDGIVSPLFPKDNDVVNKNDLEFKWTDERALKYLIKIDNRTYETTEPFFIPPDPFEVGYHEWTVKPFFEDDGGNWFIPNRFYFNNVEEKTITKEEVIQKDVDLKIIAISALVLIILLTILIRPFYKRYAIKQKLSKTYTDWCPYCHKFTGGTKICPHCGKEIQLVMNFKQSNLKLKTPKKD